MAKKKAKKDNIKSEEIKPKWDDLNVLREEIIGKIAEAQGTIISIMATIEDNTGEDFSKLKDKEGMSEEKLNLFKTYKSELDEIIRGFVLSIKDIAVDTDRITEEHGERVDVEGTKMFRLKAGDVNLDDMSQIMTYNMVYQNYVSISHRLIEIYTKTIPEIFLKAGFILESDEIVNEVNSKKEVYDNLNKAAHEGKEAFQKLAGLSAVEEPNNAKEEVK